VDIVSIYRNSNKHKHTLVVIEKEDGSEQEFIAGRHTSDKRIYELASVITPRKIRKG